MCSRPSRRGPARGASQRASTQRPGYAASVEREDLPRKPLAEAVFEFRWKLRAYGPRPNIDPNYKLLVGSLFGQVRQQYPEHEELPAAAVPDEIVPHIIQHRFRSPGGYPLLQVGPGIFAVNETERYTWKTFKPTVLTGMDALQKAYPGDLGPDGLVLRYINTVPFDSSTGDVLRFARENLNVSVELPETLFRQRPIEPNPTVFGLQMSYRLTDPLGAIAFKIGDAKVPNGPSVAWEVIVQSQGNEVPDLDHLKSWLDRAHAVARSSFFALIEGPLEAEFRR